MVSKVQLKNLEAVLNRAAMASIAHSDAVRAAEVAFVLAFGVDVPEESFSISGGDAKNEVGALFNSFVNYAENMSGPNNDVADLVQKMKKLMREK